MKQYPLLAEAQNQSIFDYDSADEVVKKLKALLHVPHVGANKSALGGKEQTSILLGISLDQKDTWPNGIYDNSRYVRIHIFNSGVVELISSSYKIPKKLRKFTAKSVDDLIAKLNKYLDSVS